jgi:hypothetical protein
VAASAARGGEIFTIRVVALVAAVAGLRIVVNRRLREEGFRGVARGGCRRSQEDRVIGVVHVRVERTLLPEIRLSICV